MEVQLCCNKTAATPWPDPYICPQVNSACTLIHVCAPIVCLLLQGKLSGYGIEDQLPTVAIVAHYDAHGLAPVSTSQIIRMEFGFAVIKHRGLEEIIPCKLDQLGPDSI